MTLTLVLLSSRYLGLLIPAGVSVAAVVTNDAPPSLVNANTLARLAGVYFLHVSVYPLTWGLWKGYSV